jgi:hypothetical protein
MRVVDPGLNPEEERAIRRISADINQKIAGWMEASR